MKFLLPHHETLHKFLYSVGWSLQNWIFDERILFRWTNLISEPIHCNDLISLQWMLFDHGGRRSRAQDKEKRFISIKRKIEIAEARIAVQNEAEVLLKQLARESSVQPNQPKVTSETCHSCVLLFSDKECLLYCSCRSVTWVWPSLLISWFSRHPSWTETLWQDCKCQIQLH